MRKIWVGYLPTLLIVASSVLGQDHGTAMLLLKQPDCPATLIRSVHSLEDFLQSATLKNVSNASLSGYRIGWVVVYRGGKNKVGLGLPVDVPEGIEPGETADVPAQGVNPNFAEEGAYAVVFFLTDVRTPSGTVWKPELARIERDARQLANLTLAPSN